ncbi:hypothetical protein D3C81_2050500 [compost metagenome]
MSLPYVFKNWIKIFKIMPHSRRSIMSRVRLLRDESRTAKKSWNWQSRGCLAGRTRRVNYSAKSVIGSRNVLLKVSESSI